MAAADELGHRIFRLRHLVLESLYARRSRDVALSALARQSADGVEAEIAAAELRLRITHQLNPAKIADFLSRFCPSPGAVKEAEEIVDGVDDFVRLIYAANYAEARDGTFPFSVDWRDQEVTVGRFSFRAHRFVRRYPNG